MITKGSRVTFYEDENTEFEGTVVEVIIPNDLYKVLWDGDQAPENVSVYDLEEN